jgi:uncharacterized metal-binding protein YceD (DUF177 family)
MEQYVVDLKDLALEKIQLQGSFEPGILDFGSDGVRQVGFLDWTASAERAGLEIRITGSLKSTVEQMCSRCLEPARYELVKPFDLYFRQRDELMFDEDDEIELSEKDTRTAFFTGTQLAIGDILREQVLLGLPMKALCTIDCKGLCPNCGTNLNLNTCNCPGESFSPHLDTLLQLKKRLEERSS